MSAELAKIVDGLAGRRVVLVGDLMLDVFLDGEARSICREAPVPVVRLTRRHAVPGGGGNTAVNLAALGADVSLFSVVGADDDGDRVLDALAASGVRTEGVVREGARRTLALHRVSAGAHLLVRFDDGDRGDIAGPAERVLVDRLARAWAGAGAVIVCDYGAGVLTQGVRDAIARLQSGDPRLVVLDAKHLAAYRHVGVTAVKPNWGEALHLLGTGELDGCSERADGIAAHGERILELTGAQIAAVTLDQEGAIVFERGRPPHRTYAQPHPHSRAIGAGDTFVAAFALALAASAQTPAAAELASRAAEVVVSKDGTASCATAELLARIHAEDKVAASVDELRAKVDAARREGRGVVFTNGCFDILHRGHITYLNRAKTLGDVLVVGVNSDESVRRLKGPSRPLNPLDDRLSVLAALSCVDHLVAFDGDTPSDVLEAVRPDVYVKGGDYTEDSLPEAALVRRLGADVRILPYMVDRSTTSIIERIRGDGAGLGQVGHGQLPASPERR